MHIFDGVLSPTVCAGTGALAVGGVGYSLYQLRDKLSERIVPMTGMMAALVFAGQMVNFPLGLLGIPQASGHLMGAVLAAAILGPWAGCLAITLVLIVQCLLFADGGVLSLGANVLNMAVIGAWGGYAVLEVVRRRFRNRSRGTIVGVVIASWLTVMAASTVFCIELFLSTGADGLNAANILTLMVVVHSAIGLGEAVITGGIISFVLAQRPDLVPSATQPTETQAGGTFGRFVTAGLIASAAVAAFLAPFASEFDDGLETVASKEFPDRAAAEPTVLLLGDYEIASPVAGWEESPIWRRISVGLAGLLGVAVVVLIAWLFDRGLRRRLNVEAI